MRAGVPIERVMPQAEPCRHALWRAARVALAVVFIGVCSTALAQRGRGRAGGASRPADLRPMDSAATRSPRAGAPAPALNRYVPQAAPTLAPLNDAERAAIDSAMTSFGEKQADLVKLLERQIPRLELLLAELGPQERALRAADSLFAYPANLARYRDSVMHTLVRIRRFHALADRQLREMHYIWLPHTMDLMAVYTRFGELSVLRRDDPGLRSFIRLYRQHHLLMDNLALRLGDLYQVSEYLLNAKLN